MSLIGAANIVNRIKESVTTATGLLITNLAVCAHLPSSFGAIAPFLTTALLIRVPSMASSAGSATNEPSTAMITTVTPAYPNDFRNIKGNSISEANVITIVRPE